MKKKIINAFLMATLLVSAVGTFVSCKDYEDDMYVDLSGKISGVEERVKALEDWKATIKSCQCQLKDWITKQEADGLYEPLGGGIAVKNLEAAIDKIESVLSQSDGKLMNVADSITAINNAIIDAQTLAQSAYDLASSIKGCECNLEPLKKSIQDANDWIELWNDDIIQMKQDVQTLVTQQKNDSITLAELEKRVKALEDKDYHVWTIGEDGFWYDNGKKTDYKAVGQNGVNGKDGAQWTIGTDGFWYKDGEKTDYVAIGRDGKTGAMGPQGPQGPAGATGASGQNGKDADVFTIGVDGYWYKNGQIYLDENGKQVKAVGQDGADGAKGTDGTDGVDGKDADVWTIGPDGFWYKNYVKYTDDNGNPVSAVGKDGADGKSGNDGVDGKDADVWTIGTDGFWYKNNEKTDFRAIGKDGKDGSGIDEEATKTIINNILLNNYYTTNQVDSAINALAAKTDSITDALKDTLTVINNNFNNYVHVDSLNNQVINLFQDGEFVDAVRDVLDDIYLTRDEFNTEHQKVVDAIASIQSDVKDLRSDIDDMITSLVVRATSNPVIGYFNVPLNVKSAALLMYYGHQNRFVFPSNETFTSKELAGMGTTVSGKYTHNGGEFFTDGTGNAGKIYMNVNPANVSLSGKTFKLVDTQGKEAAIVLETPQASDETLRYGYRRTRSGADEGFYEARATFDTEGVKKSFISVDPENLINYAKNALKDLKQRKVSSLLSAGAAYVSAFNNKLPVYNLRAEWTNSQGQNMKVTGDVDVAVATMEPLAMNMLDQWKGTTPSMYWNLVDRINNTLDKIIHTIEIECPINIDKSDITFTNVQTDGDVLSVTFNALVNGGWETMTVKVTTDREGDELVSVEELRNLVITTTGGTTESEISANIGKLLNDLYNLNSNWDRVIEDGLDNMYNGIVEGYLTKVYNRIGSLIEKGYHMFDPIIVARSSQGVALLSKSKKRPTKANGSLTLWPTSYTMEVFAPAFKKVIAVTKAVAPSGAEDTAAAARANNGNNMATVINGDAHCALYGEPGYLYEITYAAIDYHANEVKAKFYVQF